MSKFIIQSSPPHGRLNRTVGGFEHKFPEAAVMLAFALHLLSQKDSANFVSIMPDGEHAKKFEIRSWLESEGFRFKESRGKTSYGGVYVRDHQSIEVHPKSGIGDVVGVVAGRTVIAECKGGIINTKHPGQLSKLRRGLCETVGLLMARPLRDERLIAVIPKVAVVEHLAQKPSQRIKLAGIEIALVSEDGAITYVEEK